MIKVFAQASITGTTPVPKSHQGKGRSSGKGLAKYVTNRGKSGSKGRGSDKYSQNRAMIQGLKGVTNRNYKPSEIVSSKRVELGPKVSGKGRGNWKQEVAFVTKLSDGSTVVNRYMNSEKGLGKKLR